MSSTASNAGRNLPPPQSPFVDAGKNDALSFDGYQFMLNLVNKAAAAQAAETVANNLTATGTNQATALALSADWNQFSSVPANTGALLLALQPGQSQIVFNDDAANAILVYPQPGGTINQLNQNAGFSLAAGTHKVFYFITAAEIRA